MKKLIVSTELIKKALKNAEGIENTEVAYKIFSGLASPKPVTWNTVYKANASIMAITKYDPANFEVNWAVLHLVRRAYSNKYNYYTKLVKEGYKVIEESMSSLAKKAPSKKEAPEQDEINDTSFEGSEPSSSEDEEKTPVSLKRKSTKAFSKKATGGSKAKTTSK
ncbi:hypothetical protein A0J61_10837 [Choanephora cucurbitarum]|uniref:Uncharacterized protein n=1 Tax=Choanephora cucurbitarum TaxID=101091 RepID=A0A1C7N169_9FUNG|nr:hypothetical protein A0J61_10837 [Choanephora cucurbitarum]